MTRLAVIGGGSTYTPELLAGLLDAADLALDEVVLQDVAPARLEPVTAFCQRLARHRGRGLPIRATANLDDALTGADFVIVQLRVGGQEARHDDILMGTRHGLIGQETTGVGGFAKALRTLPVVLHVAARMEALCPDAWLVNFTNPSGLVTEALLRFGRERTVGLCNVPIEMHLEIAKVLARDPADVALDWVGLNHLGWVRRVLVDGADVLPLLIDRVEAGVHGPANLPEIAYPPGFLRALGMIPSSYVRFFYAGDEMLAEICSAPKTRAQVVLDLERELFEIYRTAPGDALPAQLSQRGGAWYSRLAIEVLRALQSPAPATLIVNTRNAGAIRDLPDDAAVEVPCAVSRDGVRALPCGPVEEVILGLIRHVKAYERLAIDAALAPDRARRRALAFQALVAHPLVPTARQAAAVLADLEARGHL